MTALTNRITKLEAAHGKDDMERWLNSLSDEELDVRIAEIDHNLRVKLAAEGVDTTTLSSQEVCAIVGEFEANGGRRPARLDRGAP